MFKNKIAWITGASSGIGEATALALIDEGAVVIASAPFLEELEVVKNKASRPENFHCMPLDLMQSETLEPIANRLIEQFGRIDILMNNAGISQRALAVDTPIEVDRKIMEIDYFGAVILTKAVLPQMIKQGRGHLVCTSSMVGVFGFPLRSAYSAAKHAMHGFFEAVRIENYQHNIKVNIIIGGRIKTNVSLGAIMADGKAYGKMDDGQNKGITPQKAARQILKGIRKNKSEILVGSGELLMVRIKRWLPKLHGYLSRKISWT
ncbi:MAG: SDR family NAD(P)-dependent oxidoreductase [Bacteroidales bacterium]|jgi:short-subunit dehydrogenase|nr:SDR family NAD(P)-dependent oxidoreductase [Bacteroidales bacterium]